MVTIDICGLRRPAEQATDGGVRDQLHRRRADCQDPWVIVEIRTGTANMTLATPNCPMAGGGGRRPNDIERRIFELWDRCGMGRPGFGPSDLMSFLSRILGYM